MAVYSFKSSGTQLKRTVENQPAEPKPLPIGIKTPLQLDESGEGILTMNYELTDQVADNLRNLVQTNWGERLAFYDYGANLTPITTELVSQEDFDSEAISRISAAVSKWMPYVTLQTFESKIDYSENTGNLSHIRVTITYDIPSINVTGKKLLVTLYAV